MTIVQPKRYIHSAAGNAPEWVVAANPDMSAAIDAHFVPYAKPRSAGAIVAVLKGDELVHLKGYGCANMEFGVPWDPDIRYTFFSLSKPMLAAAMLRLSDLGQIDLDAQIRTFLPELPPYPHTPTVRHLLTHSSGLWQDEALMSLLGMGGVDRPVSLDEIHALSMRQLRLSFRPGSHHHYNDAGCRIAARIMEQVTGRSFGEAMRQLLFEPAGMDTAYTSLAEPSRRQQEASAYFYGEPGSNPETGYRVGFTAHESSGDGGVRGTIRDLVAFARFLCVGRPGERLIDRLSAPVAYRQDRIGHYRMCLNVFQHRGLEVISHSGLFGKRIIHVPQLDLWMLMMRNALETPQGVHMCDGVAEMLDLVLPHDPQGQVHLARHPHAAIAYPDAPPQQFGAAEMDVLSGTFVEPESGYVLHLWHDDGRVRARFLGEAAEIIRDPAGNGYTTHLGGISLDLFADPAGALSLLQADWPQPRRLLRVEEGDPELPPAAYEGQYLSELDTAARILVQDASLTLVIGCGLRSADRFALRHISGSIFEATCPAALSLHMSSFQLRFDVVGGKVTGFTLDTDTVRGLRFAAVRRIGLH